MEIKDEKRMRKKVLKNVRHSGKQARYASYVSASWSVLKCRDTSEVSRFRTGRWPALRKAVWAPGSQPEKRAQGSDMKANLSCCKNMNKASLFSIITIFSNWKHCRDGKFSKVISQVTYTRVSDTVGATDDEATCILAQYSESPWNSCARFWRLRYYVNICCYKLKWQNVIWTQIMCSDSAEKHTWPSVTLARKLNKRTHDRQTWRHVNYKFICIKKTVKMLRK